MGKICKEYDPKKHSLCEEGYCSARKKFAVYPSAYANLYAASVCKKKGKSKKNSKSKLGRWVDEKWVNVCEKTNSGAYKKCGRSKSSPKDYPYCRPSVRVNSQTPKTASELTSAEKKKLCTTKQTIENKMPSQKGRAPKRMKSLRTNKYYKIPLPLAIKLEELAKERGVSKVARGEVKSTKTTKGFLQVAKQKKGNLKALEKEPVKKGSSQTWANRRDGFCSRHAAQASKRKKIETKGKYKGTPTRQQLGMIMWMCSSMTPKQVEQTIPLVKKIIKSFDKNQ